MCWPRVAPPHSLWAMPCGRGGATIVVAAGSPQRTPHIAQAARCVRRLRAAAVVVAAHTDAANRTQSTALWRRLSAVAARPAVRSAWGVAGAGIRGNASRRHGVTQRSQPQTHVRHSARRVGCAVGGNAIATPQRQAAQLPSPPQSLAPPQPHSARHPHPHGKCASRQCPAAHDTTTIVVRRSSRHRRRCMRGGRRHTLGRTPRQRHRLPHTWRPPPQQRQSSRRSTSQARRRPTHHHT